ncbi:DUF1990 family protein [Allokutzneria albata]|uniref:Uncharacterized protein, UPF0548 family n=1 Tax=Allokutzneria albata TaxID=211114 RepID=A0A1G9UY98_ALLAB|nr:DUF1990 domain-containing protein [Allokutzneria albata]SDM64779.1 Uncharacterized protein, UPF0548 family [Allokutzneria albata]
MGVDLLDAERVAALRAARLTYPEVGATRGVLPPGYRTFTRSVVLPVGTDFASATRDLFSWQVQRRAGLGVAASTERLEPDAVVVLKIGFGWLAVHAPCRVVHVIIEPRRTGFAYGTLPGHPECGEEAFVLEHRDDDRVTFTLSAFSRPATVLAKLGGPLARRVQDVVTGRYLRALAG